MNCDSVKRRLDEWAVADLPEAVCEHLAQCPACAAEFAKVLRGDLDLAQAHEQFRRGHAALRAQLMQSLPAAAAPTGLLLQCWRWIGATPMRRRIACATAFASASAIVVAMVVMLGVASPQSVLAETAEVLKGVDTIHFRIHAFIPKGLPVRECWTKGDKTYVQVHYKGDLIRVWLEPERYVVYEKKHNRVTITQPPPGLGALMRQINDIREFDPQEWEPCEPSQVMREGRACRVFQAPGTGTFTGSTNGVKVSGDSLMRILIDEKTHLPSSLEGLLKPKGSESWQPHLRIEFIWDGPRAKEDLFEPNYPDTAEVRDRRPPAPTPAELPGDPIATASWEGKVGITLEKLWLHPGGLLVLRAKLHGRMPSARPPELKDPEANPWGLGPSEIAAAVAGQVLLDGVPAKKLGVGAVKGRWAGYLVYRFEPSSDFSTPETLLYRHLLVRTRPRADKSRKAYLNSILTDPSSWGLYDMTVSLQEHVSEQIPDEILRSPNLRMRPPLKSVVVDILRAYERAEGKDGALAFYQAQAPAVQHMLKSEVDRLHTEGER